MKTFSHPIADDDLIHILNVVGPLWYDLKNSSLLITGSTGFFGKWLLESISFANRQLALNVKVHAVSRDPEFFLSSMPHLRDQDWIRWIRGDLANLEIPDNSFSHILHAGATSGQAIQPIEMVNTVVHGTENILRIAKASRARKLLFVSSGAVYGKMPQHLTHFTEDFLGGPNISDVRMTYGESKRLAELLCHIHAETASFDLKIARCFAFVGPHLPLNAHFAIGNFIRDALAGNPIRIRGDGSPVRSYLYAADLAAWLWLLLLSHQTGVYNVGSDQAFSIRRVAELVAESSPSATQVEVLTHPDPSSSPERYVPSVSKITNVLPINGWANITESIRRTFRYHRPA